jgi:hypothetical protein
MTQPTPAQQLINNATKDVSYVWRIGGAALVIIALLSVVIAALMPADKGPAPATTVPVQVDPAGQPAARRCECAPGQASQCVFR